MPDIYKLNLLREQAWKLEQELHEDDPRLFETKVLAFLLECELERYQDKIHEKVSSGSIHYDYMKNQIYSKNSPFPPEDGWPPVKVVAEKPIK
jgi:hypothetical protein